MMKSKRSSVKKALEERIAKAVAIHKEEARLKKTNAIIAFVRKFRKNVYKLNDNYEVFGYDAGAPHASERLNFYDASIPVKWTLGSVFHYSKDNFQVPDYRIDVLAIEVTKTITIYRSFDFEERFFGDKEYRNTVLATIIGLI